MPNAWTTLIDEIKSDAFETWEYLNAIVPLVEDYELQIIDKERLGSSGNKEEAKELQDIKKKAREKSSRFNSHPTQARITSSGRQATTISDIVCQTEAPYSNIKKSVKLPAYSNYVDLQLAKIKFGCTAGILSKEFQSAFRQAIIDDYGESNVDGPAFWSDLEYLISKYEANGEYGTNQEVLEAILKMMLAGSLLGPKRTHLEKLTGYTNMSKFVSTSDVKRTNGFIQSSYTDTATVFLIEFCGGSLTAYTTLPYKYKIHPGDRLCLGRNPERMDHINIALADQTKTAEAVQVSREHLSIFWQTGNWYLQDHSQQKTLILSPGSKTSREIHNDKTKLRHGDLVCLGSNVTGTGFRFEQSHY